MKYIKTDKFYELNTMNNFQGLGQDNFQAFERGEEVELDDAPKELMDYIHYLEQQLETPIKIVSVGPDRTQTLNR